MAIDVFLSKHTLGVFLSVFRLTSTGLSYLTRDAFGGIMISVQCLDSLETVFCARQVCCFYDNRPLRMSSKQETVKK